MKIKNIKKEGKNKYRLQLEDDIVLKVYDNVILNNQLLFKKDISPELFEKIEKENKKEDIYYQIIHFISKKMRSKQEVINFLKKYDISFDEEKRIIDKLEKDRFINDELYTRAYIQDHMYLSSDGPRKIKEYLISNYISEDVIDKYLAEIEKEEIYRKLEKLILKKMKSNTSKSAYVLKQKIIYEASNLGYDKAMIDEIIGKYSINNSDVVRKEYQRLYRKLSLKYQGEELKKQVYYKLKQKGFSGEEIENIDN